jgi:hypothetical protein
MLDDLPGRVSVEQVRDRILIIYDVKNIAKIHLKLQLTQKIALSSDSPHEVYDNDYNSG